MKRDNLILLDATRSDVASVVSAWREDMQKHGGTLGLILDTWESTETHAEVSEHLFRCGDGRECETIQQYAARAMAEHDTPSCVVLDAYNGNEIFFVASMQGDYVEAKETMRQKAVGFRAPDESVKVSQLGAVAIAVANYEIVDPSAWAEWHATAETRLRRIKTAGKWGE